MLRERRQIELPGKQLEQGLAGSEFPGEPVAIIEVPLTVLAHRVQATLQHSFDNLDELDFALFDLGSGLHAALVHHAGMPENTTELDVDHTAWRHADVLEDVLQGLDVSPNEVSWRQEWPTSALSD